MPLNNLTALFYTDGVRTPAYDLCTRTGKGKWQQIQAGQARQLRWETLSADHSGKLPRDGLAVECLNALFGQFCRCCKSHKQVYKDKRRMDSVRAKVKTAEAISGRTIIKTSNSKLASMGY